MAVFMPDKQKQPLMPCAAKRARLLLRRGRAVVVFQTENRVMTEVPSRKKAGAHVGRVTVRASGKVNIQAARCVVQGIFYRHCRRLQRAGGDGSCVQPTLKEQARRAA
jgi:hypothetical protein